MDALKIYEDALDDLATDLITEDEFTKIIKCLRDVQEIKHGHWQGNGYDCSVCGKWSDVLQGTAEMNYCPNCGAKMDEEVENGSPV